MFVLMHTSKLTGSVFSSTFLFSRKRNFCLEKQDTFGMTFLKLIISLVLKDASHHFQDFVSRQMTFWFLHFSFYFIHWWAYGLRTHGDTLQNYI